MVTEENRRKETDRPKIYTCIIAKMSTEVKHIVDGHRHKYGKGCDAWIQSTIS